MAKKSKTKKYKFKPSKAVMKRIKITGTGKIKVRRQGKGHLLSGKSGNRRRKLGRPLTISKVEHTALRRIIGI